MPEEVVVSLWRCTRDNSIVGGAPYCERDVVRSWNLSFDFVTLMPINLPHGQNTPTKDVDAVESVSWPSAREQAELRGKS